MIEQFRVGKQSPWSDAQEQAPVLVLELCASDLWALIRSAPQPLGHSFIKYIMQSIFRGLAACHAAGTVVVNPRR